MGCRFESYRGHFKVTTYVNSRVTAVATSLSGRRLRAPGYKGELTITCPHPDCRACFDWSPRGRRLSQRTQLLIALAAGFLPLALLCVLPHLLDRSSFFA